MTSRGFALWLCVAGMLGVGTAQAAVLTWKGHDWNVTSGAMAGVAQGSPGNVSVDASGYLHLKITNTGGTWTAAEVFTTDKLGFGTYQWQIDGPIDRLDKNVVVGLFPYGPAAGIGQDGTNEIDIEYAFWGNASGPNGDWTDYPASGTTIGELSYTFSLSGGTYSTSRFIWSKTSIQDFLMSGFHAVGDTAGLLKSWTYAPPNPTVNIPQQAMPLGINLWCFQATPSNGQNVEVVIRDFQFVAEGTGGDAGLGGDGSATASGADSGAGAGANSGADSGADSGAGAASGADSAPAPATPGASSGCSCDVTRADALAGARSGAALLSAAAFLVLRRRRRRRDEPRR